MLPKNISGEIFDLGSGNGFPGVVLSILRPEVNIKCIDSDERKIAFTKQLGLRLGLKNLEARVARVEDLPISGISVGTARGLASLEKLLKITNEKFKTGGALYSFKGPEYIREINDASSLIGKWALSVLGEYDFCRIYCKASHC